MYRSYVPREMRLLVPVEILAIVAIPLLPLPETVPIALPLLIAAALARWVRGRPLIEPSAARPSIAIGLVVGLVALGLALLLTDGDMWATYPIVRGNAMQAATVALVVVTVAFASELALRGWIVERALELRLPPATAIALGALAEGMITPGGMVARLGAAMFGVGLGWMYVAGGRNLGPPVAARMAFGLGALVLEALRLVG